MDGFEVKTVDQAAPWGELFITATGNVNVFRREHFVAMPDGAIMANSGHFDAELDLKALRALAEGHVREVRENVQEFDLGPKKVHSSPRAGSSTSVRPRATGRGHGHELREPGAVRRVRGPHHAELEAIVYNVPEAIDQEVARLKLEALGHHIDGMTAEQEAYSNSWTSGT